MPANREATARLAVVPTAQGPVARLRALVDEQRWVELGWDPASHILTPDRTHPVLGYAVCGVDGCDFESLKRSGLCDGCDSVWTRSPKADLDAFKAAGVQRSRWSAARRQDLCRVCRTPGHERPVKSHGLCRGCAGRARARNQSAEAFVVGDSRFPPATPLRTFGRCQVAACTAWAETGGGLCLGHSARWARGGKPAGSAFSTWCRAEASSRVGRTLVFNLRGVGERIRMEVLYGLQVAVNEGRRTPPAAVAQLVDFVRRSDIESLLDLAGRDCAGAGHHGGLFLRFAVARLRGALSDPETEATKNDWDLRVFGHGGRLNFAGIAQPWLRDAAKQWALAILARTTARRPGLGEPLSALGVLSASLAKRPDGGVDPRRLGRGDVEAFTNRVAHLRTSGTLSTYQRFKTIEHVGRFLRQARQEGLARNGAPMAGLPEDFAVGPLDHVRRPGADDEAGRALPEAVMDQLLSDESLRLLEDQRGPAWRALVELQAAVGRRTAEVCQLRWDCLAYDENVDDEGTTRRSPILVHDMPKVGVEGCRLPITDTEAALIRSQQQRCRESYPHTPKERLALFPTPIKNPDGTRAMPPAQLAHVLRTWVDAMPSLDSPERDAEGLPVPFPRELVNPYAFRHSFAQRHADAGTPVDVLKELMGHTAITSTQGYYRVTARRRRSAVDALAALQVDRHGRRIRPLVETLLESEALRDQVGQVSVPFGICVEPSNVRAQGRACPFRFQCLGCAHFRTDPSYQDELRSYLTQLLKDKERLAAAVPDLEDWARRGALPSEEEIEALRRLVQRNEDLLVAFDPAERAAIDEAIHVMKTARAQLQTAVPIQLLGVGRQPAPTVHPQVHAAMRRPGHG